MRYLTGASSGTVVAGGNGGGASINQLNSPLGIHYDAPSDSLIIVNFNSNNVVRWVIGDSSWTLVAGSSAGTSGSSSTSLWFPFDVTLDAMGNVYVSDRSNQRIQFFLAGQSNGTTIAGTTGISGSSSTHLGFPLGIALDSQSNVYTADLSNNRIQKFTRF